METVLFACIHNAGRSQMAAAWFNKLAAPSIAQAISAGTAPRARIDPRVMQVMHQAGVELADAPPRLLTKELAESASMLVTMGCGESCPVVPGIRRDDWALDDPEGQTQSRVREIRDEIHERVKNLILAQGWQRP